LKEAFPGCFRPLSENAEKLSDLQLGYGLILALLLGIVGLFVRRSFSLFFIVSCICGIFLLLLPIPGWSELVWLKLAPEIFRRLTYYWPMHRLYMVLATLAIFAGALGQTKLRLSLSSHFQYIIKG